MENRTSKTSISDFVYVVTLAAITKRVKWSN